MRNETTRTCHKIALRFARFFVSKVNLLARVFAVHQHAANALRYIVISGQSAIDSHATSTN